MIIRKENVQITFSRCRGEIIENAFDFIFDDFLNNFNFFLRNLENCQKFSVKLILELVIKESENTYQKLLEEKITKEINFNLMHEGQDEIINKESLFIAEDISEKIRELICTKKNCFLFGGEDCLNKLQSREVDFYFSNSVEDLIDKIFPSNN